MLKSKTLIAAATAAAFAFAGSAFAQQPVEPPQEDMIPPAQDTTMPADPMAEDGLPPVDDTAAGAMPETQVTEADLRGALEQVGYTEVENVDITPPMWSAEAVNPQGDQVVVQIDASTATIVAEQPVETEDAE